MMQQFRLRRSTPIVHRQSIHGQIQPAFKSLGIADICRPDAVGFVDIEVAINSVGCHRNRMTAFGCHLKSPSNLGFQTQIAHEPKHLAEVHPVPLRTQFHELFIPKPTKVINWSTCFIESVSAAATRFSLY